MLRELVSRIFGRKVQSERYGLDNLDDDVIGYPPTQQGIPIVQTQILLDRMNEDINFICGELGLSDSEFDEYLRPAMETFVAMADLLPASEFKHHATGGGLVYHSFDVAKRAMRGAQHTHFPATDVSAAKTQQSNRHWKSATVLSALLHDAGKIVTDFTIWNGDRDNEIVWDAHSNLTINQWAKKHKLTRFYIKYNKNRHQKHHNASISMMQRIIPDSTWSWIAGCEDGKAIHNTMLEAVSGNNKNHVMCQLIALCDAKSVKHDMLHNHSHITKEIKQVPLSELLADLIRHRVLEEQWLVNQKNAKLWYIDNNIYVLWEASVIELAEELLSVGYNVPKVPDVLARICIEEGMATAVSGDELYTKIKPEILGTKTKPVTLNCLKFNRVERLIPNPERLYSLKNHPEKKKEEETADQEQATDTSATSSSPSQQSSTHTSQCKTDGSIKSSLVKVLSALAKKKKESEPESSTKTPQEAPEPNSEDSTNGQEPEHTPDLAVLFEHPIAKKLIEYGLSVENGKVIVPESDIQALSGQLNDDGIDVHPFHPRAQFEGINELEVVAA